MTRELMVNNSTNFIVQKKPIKIINKKIEDLVFIDKIRDNMSQSNVKDALHELLIKSFEYILRNKDFNILLWQSTTIFPKTLKDKGQTEIDIFYQKLYTTQFKLFKKGIEEGIIKEKNIQNLIDSFFIIIEGNFLMCLFDRFSFNKLNNSFNIFWNGIKR